MERRITRKLATTGTGSNATAAMGESTSSDTDSSADSRSKRKRKKSQAKKQEAILQSKRATTELVEIKKALMARLTPSKDAPEKEGGESNPESVKAFTLEEWKEIAKSAVDLAKRSHPPSPAPGTESNSSKGVGKRGTKGVVPKSARVLVGDIEDDIFAGFEERKVVPPSKQQAALDHIRQALSETAKNTDISKIAIGQLGDDEGEESKIRAMSRTICGKTFVGEDHAVGLEGLCDTFGIKTTANTTSGIITVILRVCRRTKTPLSSKVLQVS